jgi:hypothetical protein
MPYCLARAAERHVEVVSICDLSRVRDHDVVVLESLDWQCPGYDPGDGANDLRGDGRAGDRARPAYRARPAARARTTSARPDTDIATPLDACTGLGADTSRR